jgi:signal transduction histidine kinase/ligand-binding sensor domain-containing protein
MKRKSTLLVLLFLAFFTKAQDFDIKPVFFTDAPVGVLGMAQDRYGFVWLADNGNGLYKYDGTKTIVYKPEPGNPNSISSGRIENVVIDREGILWLPHFDAGLDRFDSETETFTNFKHNDQDTTTICSNGVRDVVEDLDGNLWIGTNLGLDKFDKKTGKFIHNFSNDPDAKILRNEHIRKLYLDKSGTIWIGAGSAFFGEETTGGLFSLNPKSGEINVYRHTKEQNSLIDNRVRGIFEDSRGVFWIGTAGDGLHIMNREEGTFTRYTHDPQKPKKLSRPPIRNIFPFGVDHITFIDEDEEGCIWIGTFGNGISRFNPKTEITDHYGPDETGEFKIDVSAYWDFLKTRDGLLWLASFNTDGTPYMLTKLDITPRKINFIEWEGINSVAENEDGHLYIGTNEGVQSFINGERKYIFKTFDKLPGDNQGVREIKFDDKGNIWAGTSGQGLFFYNIESNAIKNYRHQPENSNSLSNDYVGTILIQENGEIFIGTNDGLDILNPDNSTFEHFELKNVFNNNESIQWPKLVAVDGQKRIWLAGSGGVFSFDRESGKFTKYNLGLGNEIINDLFKDEDGVIWIATINHGLRRFNDENNSFQPVLDQTGYLNKYSYVAFVAQDKSNAMWFSVGADNRLIKYSLDSNQGTLFGGDELRGNSRYYLQETLVLSNGEILIKTRFGYFRFHPNDFILSESATKKPFVQKLIINNKILNVSDNREIYDSFRSKSSIKLSHDQNDLSFQVGYIDFENNQVSQTISYKLENYDKEWRSALSGDKIAYYQLPSGQYNLQIKAQDIYGNWGEENLSIFIAAPWYLRWWAYCIYASLFIVGVVLVDRYQRKRLLKKAGEQARERELEQAKKIKIAFAQLEQAHSELKSTQSQLIQSEKMASLGELTAGIAHEIQNPLNFVNNFSEVNSELIDELSEEVDKGNLDEVKAIAKDIKENEQKINHHGKRADAIVKGMLQHSRTSSGVKEPTDINALADEYLRLSYHGLRAKDKSFNADFKTEFDETLPKINVIPQDIGRVLLNLINNAFYAVSEARSTKREAGSKDYKPEVIVSTKKNEKSIEIRVKDNGGGIPQNIVDKIFQPFFTTKPTGSGTGLGLSLSYDIVKAHGGEIKVNSNEGEARPDDPVGRGTEFIIQLNNL